MFEIPDLRPLIWLAVVGLLACGAGGCWLISFLIGHLHFAW